MRQRTTTIFLPLLLLWSAVAACALGEPKYVESAPTAGGFAIVRQGSVARIYVDSGDYPGVTRAAGDLRADIARVTGLNAEIVHETGKGATDAILIGTIGKSAVIDRLIRENKIDVGAVKGKWESTLIQVVERPLPGVKRGLVIAGSDKRGTIYGIYDLSAADRRVAVVLVGGCARGHKDERCSSRPGATSQGEPAVKYRGIFINDEAPALRTGRARSSAASISKST